MLPRTQFLQSDHGLRDKRQDRVLTRKSGHSASLQLNFCQSKVIKTAISHTSIMIITVNIAFWQLSEIQIG